VVKNMVYVKKVTVVVNMDGVVTLKNSVILNKDVNPNMANVIRIKTY